MKIKELFENIQNLIGYKIRGQVSDPSKIWDGDFDCANEHLTSLEGAPKEVDGFLIAMIIN